MKRPVERGTAVRGSLFENMGGDLKNYVLQEGKCL